MTQCRQAYMFAMFAMLKAKEDRTKALVAMETGIWSRLPPEVQNLIIERLAASAVQGGQGGVIGVAGVHNIDDICNRLIPKVSGPSYSRVARFVYTSGVPMRSWQLMRDWQGSQITSDSSTSSFRSLRSQGFLEGNTPALSTLQINIDDRYVDKYALKVRKGKAVLTVDAYENELKQLKTVLRSLAVPLVLLRFNKVEIEQKEVTKYYLSARRAVFCRQEQEGIWFHEKGDAAETQ
ncbi:hypothetical protein LTR17_002984 [Elasticomyces elasticus]|nr:hypothetical protein LTR17_002984 [Elasticomyces elasticus]